MNHSSCFIHGTASQYHERLWLPFYTRGRGTQGSESLRSNRKKLANDRASIGVCATQFGSHWPHVALKHLKCGYSKSRCAISLKYTLTRLQRLSQSNRMSSISLIFYTGYMLKHYYFVSIGLNKLHYWNSFYLFIFHCFNVATKTLKCICRWYSIFIGKCRVRMFWDSAWEGHSSIATLLSTFGGLNSLSPTNVWATVHLLPPFTINKQTDIKYITNNNFHIQGPHLPIAYPTDSRAMHFRTIVFPTCVKRAFPPHRFRACKKGAGSIPRAPLTPWPSVSPRPSVVGVLVDTEQQKRDVEWRARGVSLAEPCYI